MGRRGTVALNIGAAVAAAVFLALAGLALAALRELPPTGRAAEAEPDAPGPAVEVPR